MRQILLTLMSLLLFVSLAYADNGLISIKSPYDVKKTAERLENALNAGCDEVIKKIEKALGNFAKTATMP